LRPKVRATGQGEPHILPSLWLSYLATKPKEINSLKNVASAIADTVSSPSIRDQAWLDDNAQDVFTLLEGLLKGCGDNLQRFKTVLTEVKSSRFSATVLRQPITLVKLDMKSSQIMLLRRQIASHFGAMQLGLQTINL